MLQVQTEPAWAFCLCISSLNMTVSQKRRCREFQMQDWRVRWGSGWFVAAGVAFTGTSGCSASPQALADGLWEPAHTAGISAQGHWGGAGCLPSWEHHLSVTGPFPVAKLISNELTQVSLHRTAAWHRHRHTHTPCVSSVSQIKIDAICYSHIYGMVCTLQRKSFLCAFKC